MAQRFYIETLGCPKNQVDSDKLVGTLLADGLQPTESVDEADLVVVNTCAFIEEARQESVDTILTLSATRARPVLASSSPVVSPSGTATSSRMRSPRSTRWPASACR